MNIMLSKNIPQPLTTTRMHTEMHTNMCQVSQIFCDSCSNTNSFATEI